MNVSSHQQKIFEALAGNAALSAEVGTRVYADHPPQGVTSPYIVWQEISFENLGTSLDGSPTSDSRDKYRIQVTCWAGGSRGASTARSLDQLVRAAMAAASGMKSIHVDARSMSYEPDVKLYGFQSDFSVTIST